MQAFKRRQEGAFLILVIMTIVVLLGIASLALDIGRVFVVRAEMQQAVDAAALAAAVELDQKDGAMLRAMDAARHTINENSRFAKITELLGEEALPDEAFTFFCVIGSSYDIEPDEDGFAEFCSGSQAPDEANKYLATSNTDAHYVRISLDKALTDTDHYTIDLIFLPILELLNINTLESVSLTAKALAGRSFYTCNYPPMAICDPFENHGTTFKDSMPEGGHIELKQQGSNQWSSGNFGFLETYTGGGGASDVSLYLADEGITGCTPPMITTKPGNMTNKTKSALNTRFDEYSPPAPFNTGNAPSKWPPAPAITEYALDNTTLAIDSRFGNGDWDFPAHRQALISAGKSVASMPTAWGLTETPTRWEVYNWEISSNNVLTAPNPNHLNTGDYPPPRSIPERRLLYVAVISCESTGLTGGKSTTPIFDPDGFAKIFLIKKAEGPPDGRIWGEYIGWGEESDEQLHIDIQLYE